LANDKTDFFFSSPVHHPTIPQLFLGKKIRVKVYLAIHQPQIHEILMTRILENCLSEIIFPDSLPLK